MDGLSFGSAGFQMKTARLKTQWNIKKATGNVSAHVKSLDDLMAKSPAAAFYQSQIDQAKEEEQENGGEELNRVINKVYAGAPLSPEERTLLKEKSPAVYQQLEEAERQEAAYEQELRQCRTKEDVQRLKQRYANASLVRVRAVSSNPHIPAEKKEGILRMEQRKLAKYEESTRRFVDSGKYSELPTDAEKEEVERAEAEEAREAAETAAKQPEEKQEKGAPLQRRTENSPGVPRISVQEERKPNRGQEERKPDRETWQKVRRARREAAYVPAWVAGMETGGTDVDVKA